MDQIVIDLDEKPSISLEAVSGDLRLTGWEQKQFLAESSDDQSLHTTRDGNQVSLRASSDCSVRVPRGAQVSIASVGGDAKIKALDGALTIRSVSGDLSLRQGGPAEIGQVGGDLKAKKLNGPLRVERVSGDVSASSIAGEFQARAIGADLNLRDVDGPISAQTSGDIFLTANFKPGQAYALQAGGDITCRLAPGASVRLALEAGGEIVVDVAEAQMEGQPRQRTITLRGGEAQASLRASGNIVVTGLSADPDAMGDFGERFGDDFGVMAEEFATQIETQIETQMADLEKQLSERLAHINVEFGAGGDRAEELAARARRASEAARRKTETAQRKVESKLEAARRRIEREAERSRRMAEAAERRTGRRHAHLAFKFEAPRPPASPNPPRPPTAPSDPVTDEERMVILRMVEQGKISVADAEKLLAALENR